MLEYPFFSLLLFRYNKRLENVKSMDITELAKQAFFLFANKNKKHRKRTISREVLIQLIIEDPSTTTRLISLEKEKNRV